MRGDIGIHRAERERGIRHDVHRRNIRSVDGVERNPDHLFDDRVKIDVRVIHRYARADTGCAAGGQRPTHKRFVRADFERGHAVRRDDVARIRRARFGDGTELVIEEHIVGGFKLCSQRGRAVGCYRLCAKGIKFCIVCGEPADKLLSGGGSRNFRRIHRVAAGNNLGCHRCRTNHKGVCPERCALRQDAACHRERGKHSALVHDDGFFRRLGRFLRHAELRIERQVRGDGGIEMIRFIFMRIPVEENLSDIFLACRYIGYARRLRHFTDGHRLLKVPLGFAVDHEVDDKRLRTFRNHIRHRGFRRHRRALRRAVRRGRCFAGRRGRCLGSGCGFFRRGGYLLGVILRFNRSTRLNGCRRVFRQRAGRKQRKHHQHAKRQADDTFDLRPFHNFCLLNVYRTRAIARGCTYIFLDLSILYEIHIT